MAAGVAVALSALSLLFLPGYSYVWVILVAPLGAFVLSGLLGRRTAEGGGFIAIGGIFISLVLSVYLLSRALLAGAVGVGFGGVLLDGYVWLPGFDLTTGLTSYNIRISLWIDTLSVVLLALVSFLCFLIFVYSLGYMHREEGKPRYYAEVSLFAAGMLGTVSASNFLQLLIFWEIMGLCSYLLIGFWYSKPEAAKAAKKAFMVTRVGDVLFLIGVLIIWSQFGSLDIYGPNGIAARVGILSPQLLTLIPLLLFGGAVGKSAQFPLHAWLPDAMEGPTTVSALIHAATMVNAGVYLTARAFIFLVPMPLNGVPVDPPWTAIFVVAGIGGFSALFAASMAIVNYDIKRVLAFSTISQLAYMFLGLGAGAFVMASGLANGAPYADLNSAGYSAAIFHLVNQAFFKGLLFLCAGSVLHAVETNDMRKMGGLRKSMPVTAYTMLLGSLALAGIVPFSGFFSKGEVLSTAFEAGTIDPVYLVFWLFGVVTAFLTAFYAFRLWFMTFDGAYRGHEHPHEAPKTMTIPLIILGAFTLISGLSAYPVGGFGNLIFVPGTTAEYQLPLIGVPLTDYVLEAFSLGPALLGFALAWAVYSRKSIPAERFTRSPSGAFVHEMLSRRYWIDDVYDAFGARVYWGFAKAMDWFDRRVIDGIVNAVGRGGIAAAAGTDYFDRHVVDGAVNLVSEETIRSGLRLRQRQTGQVQSYAWVVVFGIAVVIALVFGVGWYLRLRGGG